MLHSESQQSKPALWPPSGPASRLATLSSTRLAAPFSGSLNLLLRPSGRPVAPPHPSQHSYSAAPSRTPHPLASSHAVQSSHATHLAWRLACLAPGAATQLTHTRNAALRLPGMRMPLPAPALQPRTLHTHLILCRSPCTLGTTPTFDFFCCHFCPPEPPELDYLRCTLLAPQIAQRATATPPPTSCHIRPSAPPASFFPSPLTSGLFVQCDTPPKLLPCGHVPAPAAQQSPSRPLFIPSR